MELLVLGTAQDGGYPHTGCSNECCSEAWSNNKLKRLVTSLAIISNNEVFIFDITPDFKLQLQLIEKHLNKTPKISGVFITHAHYGHYMGILELGLEVMNTKNIPVYVMPRMKQFLDSNAPFIQLVEQRNIKLIEIRENQMVNIDSSLNVFAIPVPHRNEFSETVGYSMQSQKKSILFIPDIDSWNQFELDINELIKKHDLALLDGTFYDKSELKSRNIDDIPHPSIKESIKEFSMLDSIDRKKVNFIHMNHTNNALKVNSRENKYIHKQGFKIAFDGMHVSI